ncbi:hypothetical protein SAMN06295910_1026 [Allosphingosinicella indica]|uniref:Lipoprotein n=2 Tax=Allosphingosinicella indica TaxID=941907 RepID=A0A1X7G2K9_9SPHN|nr:hypothetical protein SAMN06295910_1026 [Allosphingosinicella indica]
MKVPMSAALASALALAACGPKALELPADPIDRAATCGVVAAANARSQVAELKAPLPFEAQTKIVHYTMIAASNGGTFDPKIAGTVSERMAALQEGITEGKWQDLIPACAEAYPVAEKTDVTLPSDSFEAGLGCDSTIDFLSDAMRANEADYADQYGEMAGLQREFDRSLAPGLNARAGSRLEEQRDLRNKAVAEFTGLGSPAALLQQCEARFGD